MTPSSTSTDAPVAPPGAASPDMPDPRIAERRTDGVNGIAILLVLLATIAASVVMFVVGVGTDSTPLFTLSVLVFVAALIGLAGLTVVAPGQARVVQLLGRYQGTIRADGLRWVNPITSRREVSTRIRNLETVTAKVNDLDGNPIEISAVVVWQVADTARAVFEVDDFVQFVTIQSETAVRHIANSYPYDSAESGVRSLRDNADEITAQLAAEIADRVAPAGVRIIESRITRLAYAPEIAQAMLQRQQAGAVVAARTRIVDGAVGMVEMALARLAERGVVDLDEERKATMVSNLLVVLCGDRSTQPVVNAGSLYS